MRVLSLADALAISGVIAPIVDKEPYCGIYLNGQVDKSFESLPKRCVAPFCSEESH